jgi:type II secretory pathway component PulJ
VRPEHATECDERGTTLVEVVIVSAILLVVIGMVGQILLSVMQSSSGAAQRSEASDAARQAVETIDRLVRSGNILYDPALEPTDAAHVLAPGRTMRIYTQSNGNQRCVQWRVRAGTLEERSWSESWRSDHTVSEWRHVADGIVNTTAAPLFALDSAHGFGSRLLQIDLRTSTGTAGGGPVVSIRTAVTGRNTTYGYSSAVCADVPTY